MSHNHPHHDCGGGCSHGTDSSADLGVAYSLYTKIDLDKLQCLNESVDGSGKKIFKPWHERKTFDVYLESDCDAELLINIPFTGNVKLKSFIILGNLRLVIDYYNLMISFLFFKVETRILIHHEFFYSRIARP